MRQFATCSITSARRRVRHRFHGGAVPHRRNSTKGGYTTYMPNDTHWSSIGARIAAAEIAEACREGLISEAAPGRPRPV